MKTEEASQKGSVWREFYIDFLGSLVPGLFALILSIIPLGLSLFVLCRSLKPQGQNLQFPSGIDFGLGAYGVTSILLVLAYVLGSIFYRQDPKIPDWKSAGRIYKYVSPEERKRLAVQPTSRVPEGHNFIHQNDAQFPYFFLYEYLKGRGLDHLAEWVPWKGVDSSTWKYRTKMFINQIKIRLQFLVPERCTEIIRNEAHVRLATSVWYATRWITCVCLISFVLLIIAFIKLHAESFDHLFSAATCTDVLVLAFGIYLKRQIENFIHYLRVREIVYVLETAHFASLNGVDLHRKEFDQRNRNIR